MALTITHLEQNQLIEGQNPLPNSANFGTTLSIGEAVRLGFIWSGFLDKSKAKITTICAPLSVPDKYDSR